MWYWVWALLPAQLCPTSTAALNTLFHLYFRDWEASEYSATNHMKLLSWLQHSDCPSPLSQITLPPLCQASPCTTENNLCSRGPAGRWWWWCEYIPTSTWIDKTNHISIQPARCGDNRGLQRGIWSATGGHISVANNGTGNLHFCGHMCRVAFWNGKSIIWKNWCVCSRNDWQEKMKTTYALSSRMAANFHDRRERVLYIPEICRRMMITHSVWCFEIQLFVSFCFPVHCWFCAFLFQSAKRSIFCRTKAINALECLH